MQPGKPTGPAPANEASSPEAKIGECALLMALHVTRAGAFMQWQEGTDLLVPVSQQLRPMQKGKSYVVYLYLDPQGRPIGSSKLHRHLAEEAEDMQPNEPVDLMIVSDTDLGYKAVVNGSHLGLLFKNEVFQPLQPGETIKGYIKSIREDRKINLSLKRHAGSAQDELARRILLFLRNNGGASTLTDYSPPQAIYKQFGVSKGNYKKALGALYKKRKITVAKDKITLMSAESKS
jgi:predicted RNA-binding protein (virulence factor B family)